MRRNPRTRPTWRELSESEKRQRLALLRSRQQQQVEFEVLWLRQ